MTSLKIITLNCQGLRTKDHRDTLFSWLNCCDVDLVCLQETHSLSESEFSEWLSRATASGQNKHQFQCLSSPGTNRSSGVALLYKPTIEVVHSFRDEVGRMVGAEISFHNFFFQLCNIYAPNTAGEGKQYFESLYSFLDTVTPTILCGDFNTVPDPILDRIGCNAQSPWAYNWSPTLSCLMDTYDLHDVWRLQHPHSAEYTWRRPNGEQASRLDMYWLSAFLASMVTMVDITPFFRSDHSCVFLQLHLPSSVPRGKGIWKFNVSHLKNPDFIHLVTDFWHSWQSEKASFLSLGAWWDAGKARLREHCQHFSRSQSSAFRRKLHSLQCSLYHLQRRQDNGENVSLVLQDTKADIEEVYRRQARGARLRAQVQWAEEGESSTAYFLRLEKKRGQQRLISSIRTLSNALVSSARAIMTAWIQFYILLFSSQPLSADEQTFFLSQLQLRLSAQERDSCEGPLSNAECRGAVDAMASGKSPGIDGFPAEFYQTFWDLLGDDFVDVMNYNYLHGRLTATQRTGVITLLHKNGDRLLMQNWRPITLLCTDYKIATKAIANRLLSVIDKVTHSDQTCGVPGRNPLETARLLKDIVRHANANDIGGAVISVDQEKAFDRVEWSYLRQVLSTMNFGPSFCSWISLFYTNIHSCILINGTLSEPFSISRGVRQGCPLSPLLYVLVAETIASAIRNNPSISGYVLPTGAPLKVCQYADDTSVLVTSDAGIDSLFHLFHRYSAASGARLNISKCHGLLFGSWISKRQHVVPLDWTAAGLNILGCYVSNDGEEQWAPKVQAISSTCALWKPRKLSFHGRALVANSLATSQLWYLATCSLLPVATAKSIDNVIFRFVWNKKREWLARSSVTQKLSRGGLGVVDITRKMTALHFLWVKRLLLHPHLPWTTFFRQYLRRAFPGRSVHNILLLRYPPKYAMEALPPFYRAVMTAWFSLERQFVEGEYIVSGPKQTSMKLSVVTVKFVYGALSSLQRTQHRCVDKYSRWGLSVDWPTVWMNLHLWRFVRPIRDISWLVAHGILPTADRLLTFGMHVDPLCDCGQHESLQHLFFGCAFAQRVLAWYTTMLRRFRPNSSSPTVQEVLVGYRSSEKLPPIFSCLLGIIRYYVWLSRNHTRFDGIPRDYGRVLSQITSSARFVIRIQRQHCPSQSFGSSWLANGTFGVVIADRICFSREFRGGSSAFSALGCSC